MWYFYGGMIRKYGSVTVHEEGDYLIAYFHDDLDLGKQKRLVQSVMRISRPRELCVWYTRAMMKDVGHPKSALVIGMGTGALSKELYYKFPGCMIISIEPSKDMVGVAFKEFHVPAANRRHVIYTMTGQEFIEDTVDKYDLIMVDAFHDRKDMLVQETSNVLFYRRCREKLNDGGVLVVNMLREHQALGLMLDVVFKGQIKVRKHPAGDNVVWTCFNS